MNKKEITLCGKQVKLAYCAAAENGFEELAKKSIQDMDFTRNSDMMALAMACIVASYAESKEDAPITSEELLYQASSRELTDLYLTVISLRASWYAVPKPVADQIQKEADRMTEKEQAEAEKNAHAPTNDIAAS